MRTVVLTFLLGILLAGCADSSYVLTGLRHKPIDPKSVKIYYKAPPGDYDEIAQITAKSISGATMQGKQEYALEELQSRAASLGANAVIVSNIDSTQTAGAAFVTSTGSLGMMAPQDHAIIHGTAIYVK